MRDSPRVKSILCSKIMAKHIVRKQLAGTKLEQVRWAREVKVRLSGPHFGNSLPALPQSQICLKINQGQVYLKWTWFQSVLVINSQKLASTWSLRGSVIRHPFRCICILCTLALSKHMYNLVNTIRIYILPIPQNHLY